MSVSLLWKMHVNGYEVIHACGGPWKVRTQADRLSSFSTREEAMAYVVSLPMHKVMRAKNSQ